MKKALFLWMIFVTISSQSQTDSIVNVNGNERIKYGKFTPAQFENFKDFLHTTCNYRFADESTYLINYTQPQSDCHYNQYENKTCDNSWFEKTTKTAPEHSSSPTTTNWPRTRSI